ncbi:hypothetical protein AKJ64_00155 [candidate division MSBL1 archaeon SCGC-AAA259E17]|uniref:P-type ATPase A domain-containing protein n=1 Tax=candidate division MSBL1 archaeon SCGC-AAA259E17 TaxID=1698263 RepID=A0A133UHC3_9EURY|nr:hypothetical protein AKJ64_00155 [candidate division MSBL1 archaeon SCGC-AAA259E17]
MVPEHNRVECPYCRVDVLREKPPLWERKSISIILSSGVLFAAGLVFELMGLWETGALILFLGTAIIAGVPIAKKGIQALGEKRLDVNVLMTAAAVGAFSIGYGAEGAAVLLLFYIAEFLEDYAGERARRSVGKLLELSPETVVKKTESGEKEAHAHEVEVGDRVVVRPGERVPLDGKVREGSTSVNQAPVTGESMPVSKGEGDEVFAGTLNEEGYIELEVTKPPGKTTLTKIIELVREAQERESGTQRLVNKVASYYTPIILGLALTVAIAPVIIFSQPAENWIYRGLVLLAVSCPCAFVLSTPISMVSGITSAARNGLLIKGGTYVEEINEERVLALDKTRTLTKGRPEVTDIALFDGSEGEVLRVAVSLESKTKHPIAESIVAHGKGHGVEAAEAEEFESMPGKGIKGLVDGEKYLVGARSFFDELEIEYPGDKIKDLEAQGKTVILVGKEDRALAAIGVKDKIRENAAEMTEELKENGIKPVMLTGDNERVARAIAEELGIDEFHAGLLPEEKVEAMKKLVEEYEHVSMVGDGVNDAPALAEAHVGIAMGAAGSDVAIETADIVLMEDDLEKVGYLMRLGHKTMGTVRENIIISILTKGALAVLAVFGLISLAVAVGVGDMGISFVVIANALRLGLM